MRLLYTAAVSRVESIHIQMTHSMADSSLTCRNGRMNYIVAGDEDFTNMWRFILPTWGERLELIYFYMKVHDA